MHACHSIADACGDLAATSQASVPDNGGEGDVQVTENGILVNHAYTLLAIKEVQSAISNYSLISQSA